MPLEIVTVPCLSDNYAYLAARRRDRARSGWSMRRRRRRSQAALAERGWELDLILITHHHDDHIQGVDALRGDRGAGRRGRGRPRTGCRRSTRRWRPATRCALGRERGEVIDVPGHTVGHVAYYFAEARGAVLGRQPDGAWAAGGCSRGRRSRCGDSLSPAGGAAGRHAGLFRPRIRREQRALRAVGRRRTMRR